MCGFYIFLSLLFFRMKFTVVVERGVESGFVAFCPVLRGCVAQGRTRAQAVKNLRSAMSDYVECLVEDGIPVPQEVDKKILDVEGSVH